MKKNIACPVCNGRGFVHWFNSTEDSCSTGSKTCPHCDGTGVREVSMTNADRIRSMTDEELAKYLFEIGWDCHLCAEHERLENEPLLRSEKCDEKCVEHCLDWLKQPVEVE